MSDADLEEILDGDEGLVICDHNSNFTVVEDDKFRLCVAPVYRGMSNLLKDLEQAFYKIKNVDQIRPTMVFPDVTKLGLRYSFFEGLGFIEYGQFSEHCAQDTI